MDFSYSSKLRLKWKWKWKWLVVAATIMVVAAKVKGNKEPVIPPANSLVPAICIFGDSVVDVGNNNHRLTLLKANFPPYGRDFVTHSPTGRFCNGKLAIDFIAEFLGFSSYQPAYLSQEATEKKILIGANFASAASGYYDVTSELFGAISLPKQLDYYKEWQSKVTSEVGKKKATTMFSKTIHLLSAGSSDFIQNYYIDPLLNRVYTPDQFSDILIRSYSTFIEVSSSYNHHINYICFLTSKLKIVYEKLNWRIGVTGLPPTGCLPAAVTLFGFGSNQCVERLNQDAISFNNKLNSTSSSLRSKLHGLKLVVFDIYHPLLDIITNPADNGFFETRRACCGTGTIETSFLCNSRSLGTCENATGYVFWDGFHPSEAANMFLAGELAGQGFDLIS